MFRFAGGFFVFASRKVTLEMVPFGKLLAASSNLIILGFSRSSSSMGMSLMMIPYFGSCVLIPSKASLQSMHEVALLVLLLRSVCVYYRWQVY